jgi:hypothetical protein
MGTELQRNPLILDLCLSLPKTPFVQYRCVGGWPIQSKPDFGQFGEGSAR